MKITATVSVVGPNDHYVYRYTSEPVDLRQLAPLRARLRRKRAFLRKNLGVNDWLETTFLLCDQSANILSARTCRTQGHDADELHELREDHLIAAAITEYRLRVADWLGGLFPAPWEE